MRSYMKPYLYLTVFFLCYMLTQAWLHENKPASATSVTGVVAQDPLLKKLPVSPHWPRVRANGNIVVQTDMVQLAISPTGGFITQVDLLKYQNSLHDPQPFSIFSTPSKDSPQMYVASSGYSGDESILYSSPKQKYTLTGDSITVELTAKKNGIDYNKSYTLKRGSYEIEVESKIKNNSKKTWQGQHYSRFYAYNDTDLSKEELPQPKAFVIDPNAPKPGWFTYSTYTGPSYHSDSQPYVKLPYQQIANGGVAQKVSKDSWVAIQQRYFIAAWVAKQNSPHTVHASWQSGTIPGREQQYRQQLTLSTQQENVQLSPGSDQVAVSTLYAGPELAKLLAPIVPSLALTVDYGWLWFISDIIFQSLVFIHSYLGNWGWSIVMVTLLIKLLFYKLSESSYKSMAKQKKLRPRIAAIEEQYKDDAEKKSQAMFALYQKEGMNPLGGCLPTLLQIPCFLALYYVLIESVQLRLSKFLWVSDLSSADPLYILPLLLGVSMLLTQWQTPKQGDAMNEQVMMMMPLVMAGMLAFAPAGLVLYMLTNNLLTFLQQWYMMRKHAATD